MKGQLVIIFGMNNNFICLAEEEDDENKSDQI